MTNRTKIAFLFQISFTLLLMACSEPETEDNSVLFEWDFDQNKTYTYSYTHDISTEAKFNKDEPFKRIHSLADAKLSVVTDSTDWAKCTLSEMNLTVDDKEMNRALPPVNMEKMRSNGKFEKNNRDAFFDLLFILPGTNMEVGFQEVVNVQFPFLTPDSAYHSMGNIKFKFDRMDTLDNVECAVLNADITYVDPVFDSRLVGDFGCNGTGTGTYYFDVDKRCYKKAIIDMNMNALWSVDVDSAIVQGMAGHSEIKIHSKYEVNLQSIE